MKTLRQGIRVIMITVTKALMGRVGTTRWLMSVESWNSKEDKHIKNQNHCDKEKISSFGSLVD